MSKIDKLAEMMVEKSAREHESRKLIEAQVEEWPENLNKLYDTIENILEPLKRAGVLFKRGVITRDDGGVEVSSSTLSIVNGDKSIETDPHLFLSGSQGRVDFLGAGRKGDHVLLIKDDNGSCRWCVVTTNDYPRRNYEDISEDYLYELSERMLL